ncbi:MULTISPECIES: LapA family protein [Mumia]|uniref:LapA family protein n=1 Tax=Mumia TaxID=1546255 RepID=UPI0014247CF0|nr:MULTISPECIES: LapA family protein [unclassified Mumia]QMW66710.1 LapA family protein [Mumia sp. ZJ1417]
MIALGVLLLALAVLVGVVVSVEATEAVSVEFLGWDVTTDGVGAFWIGAGSMLVAVVGLGLITRGLRRSYQVRKENRQLRKEHRRLEQQRAQESRPAEPSALSEPTSKTPREEPPYEPDDFAGEGGADEGPHRPPPAAGT